MLWPHLVQEFVLPEWKPLPRDVGRQRTGGVTASNHWNLL